MKKRLDTKNYAGSGQAGYTLYPQRGQAGYTLIELIIVIIVVLVVGGIVVSILYSAIRGTSKAKINNTISQNGDYAITIMSDYIRTAKKFEKVTDNLGTEYLSCISGTPEAPIEASSITITGFDGGVTTFACDDVNNTISSNSASLLSTDDVETTPGTCTISCLQEDIYSAPRIDISFELQAKNAVNPETSGQALFNTSVTVRNFGL